MNELQIKQQYYLQRAYDAAQVYQGQCSPNPPVGAVLVKAGRIVAIGAHRGSGFPHAEVEALEAVDDATAAGATLYVTLEPCCHEGKTPPCTDLIIAKRIAAVYFGFQDPNPEVNGKGQATLQEAGLVCEYIPHPSIMALYESYAYWWREGRPWVNIKLALGEDGKIAGPDGERVMITGEACQRLTHQWRKRCDLLLTTATTIIYDNPDFTVRLPENAVEWGNVSSEAQKTSLRIEKKPVAILDRRLRTPPDAHIFKTAASVILFYDPAAPLERTPLELQDALNQVRLVIQRVECVPIPSVNGGLSLTECLSWLGEQGCHQIWVEAGGRCFQGFFNTRLINRAFLYWSSQRLGDTAQAAFTEPFDILAQNAEVQWQALGEDWVCELTYTA